MSYLDKIASLEKKASGYWFDRIVKEIKYAVKLSDIDGGIYDGVICKSVESVYSSFNENGTVGKIDALKAEDILSPLANRAKKLSFICASHAHIDMNWMWRFDETVSITIDTLRTMLDLMEEYPDFTYSQSQASVYKIIEDYCPEMIGEIKKRVHERRWEVTASTWVEADKNIPNMESMARHLLYTKGYLSKLLDIDPDSLDLDYEPDTFGHSPNVPEILLDGGVKYYYHCRGYDGHTLYKWQAPSGRSVTAFKEPTWYNWDIDGRSATMLPDFCKEHGLDAMLRVYGVGDHGGGPTRRDIERIIDMDTWPIFPRWKFGTYHDFYKKVDEITDSLPIADKELNFLFTGCYTTQTRIKKANRFGEVALYEAELYNTYANLLTGLKYYGETFEEGWRNVLFNQFHDIIPGSGTVDTREHAMGLFQEMLAKANTKRTLALRAISDAVDFSPLLVNEDISESRSEGAGVGFGLSKYRTSQYSRHAGIRRIFNVFNSAQDIRDEAVEITLWDWQGDKDRMVFKTPEGKALKHQILKTGRDHYWGHDFMVILVKALVPAAGYTTITLEEKPAESIEVKLDKYPRVERPVKAILENEYLKATLDTKDGSIISFVDKQTGADYASQSNPMGVFRLIDEDAIRGMTAWIVGRYTKIDCLNNGVRYTDEMLDADALRQSVDYRVKFRGSELKVKVSLDKGSPVLNFDVECLWQEIGDKRDGIPQLNFYMPLNYKCSKYRYDVPMGTADRDPADMDLPANSFAVALNENGRSLMLVSDSKHGFRGVDDSLSLTLIRSSFDPDPWPEVGEHTIRMGISLVDTANAIDQIKDASKYCHPMSLVSAKPTPGTMPMEGSLIKSIEGCGVLSSVKMAENKDDGVIIRLYDGAGMGGMTSIEFARDIKEAKVLSLLEEGTLSPANIDGNKVNVEIKRSSMATLKVNFNCSV